MMLRSLARNVVLVLCFSIFVAHTSRADEPPEVLVLSGAKVLNETGESLLEGRDLLIEDGKIVRIAAPQELEAPSTAKRLDVTGLTLIPGLMDLHTHLLVTGAMASGGPRAYNREVIMDSIPRRTVRAVAAARATLEAGFTTIRDVCTEGAECADVALRDSINEELVAGPRIFASTRGIAPTGCYMPGGFDRRFEVPQGAQVADGEVQVRRAVREQVALGADWIKIFADFPRYGPPTPTFTQEELNALVDEARTAGIGVAAHAMLDEGIRRCVRAGVRSIEHGTFASLEVLKLMQEHNVALCPTLMALNAMAPEMKETGISLIQHAREAGVTIVCGTDAGVYPHGQNAGELELYVEAGMTPAEAMRAATISAAELLGMEEQLGRIAPGYVADIVAVRGNPLEDISTLRKPIVVIKEGKVHVNRTVGADALEIDHLFILVSKDAPERQALVEAGFRDSGDTARHEGQGTASMFFFFENAYFELAWTEDEQELREGLGDDAESMLARGSWRKTGASPFGIGMRFRDGGEGRQLTFPCKLYSAEWMRPGTTAQIVKDLSEIREPQYFVVPEYMALPSWIETKQPLATEHPVGTRRLTGVRVTVAGEKGFTDNTRKLIEAGVLQAVLGEHHCLTLTFDYHAQGKTVDLRPTLPLVVQY